MTDMVLSFSKDAQAMHRQAMHRLAKTARGVQVAGSVLAGSVLVGATLLSAAQAQAPAAAAGAAAKPASSWVKLCEKGTETTKDKDGKEKKVDHTVCLTHHERIDAQSGIVLVSAAIRQVDEGKDPLFMVMLPLGMAIIPGMQVAMYPADMWDKIQKGEKVDDSKIVPIKVPFNLCHSAGCTGEVPATPEMIAGLKSNGGLIVYGLSGSRRPVAFPIPLNGFDAALTGAPASNEEYAKQRNALMKQIADNQQKLLQEYQKQNAELQNSQGQLAKGTAPGAPAAAPAKAAPAPAKK